MRSRTKTLAALFLALAWLGLAGCQTPLQGMMKNQSPVLGAVDDSKGDLKGAFGDVIGSWTDEVVEEIRPEDVPVGEAGRDPGDEGLPGFDMLGG